MHSGTAAPGRGCGRQLAGRFSHSYLVAHGRDASSLHNLFGLGATQGNTGAGAAETGMLGQTSSKYEQEKGGMPAKHASRWVAHKHPQMHRGGAIRVPSQGRWHSSERGAVKWLKRFHLPADSM